MNKLSIVNQYSVLTEVQKIDDNSILLKFQKSQYFDTEDDVYELVIQSNEIAKNIKLIEECHLDSPTVIIDKTNCLEFFIGEFDESQDWGSYFSLIFEKYDGKFTKKTKEDWKNELKYIISDQVRTKAFQTVTNQEFRVAKYLQTKKMIEYAQIDQKIKEELLLLLEKIQSFDDYKFYNIFMIGGFKLE